MMSGIFVLFGADREVCRPQGFQPQTSLRLPPEVNLVRGVRPRAPRNVGADEDVCRPQNGRSWRDLPYGARKVRNK